MYMYEIFTPTYAFSSLRNICLSLRPGTNPDNLLLLWRHECEWVYGQRLVSPVDFDRYQLAFVTAARKEFTAEEPVMSNNLFQTPSMQSLFILLCLHESLPHK